MLFVVPHVCVEQSFINTVVKAKHAQLGNMSTHGWQIVVSIIKQSVMQPDGAFSKFSSTMQVQKHYLLVYITTMQY